MNNEADIKLIMLTEIPFITVHLHEGPFDGIEIKTDPHCNELLMAGISYRFSMLLSAEFKKTIFLWEHSQRHQ